jgi:hypothetical protein
VKILLQAAAVLALLAFSVGTAVLSLDLHRALVDLGRATAHLDKSLGRVDEGIASIEERVRPLIYSIDATAHQAELAAIEQRAYWQKTSADSDKTVKAVRLTVDRAGLLLKHTDEQLNGSLLPDIDREIVLTSQTAQMSLGSLGQVSDVLAFQLNDLPISDIAGRLNETALRLDGTALALEHTAQSGEHVAKFYETKLTAPASLAKTVLTGLVEYGAKFGSMFAGFAH